MLRTSDAKRPTTLLWLLLLSLLSVASLLIPGRAQPPEPPKEDPAKKVPDAPVPNPETLSPRPTLLVSPLDEQVLTLAFSPDGKNLTTAGARHQLPGQLKVWDVTKAREVTALQ